MGLIPERVVEQVQNAADIVDVISRHVPLKRTGRSFKGLCPFHQEKTPSFHVNPERQIFHCFGCDEGGTVFTFLMKHERMTFPEAVRTLAEQAGIPVPQENDPAASSEWKDLYRVNRWGMELFEKALRHSAGKPAMEYLLGRGVTPESIEKFRLGYAPASYDALAKAARRDGFSEEMLVRAGLLRESDRGGNPYSQFRDRVIFPIVDHRDRVLGFGGRALGEAQPKYLNTSETKIFQKGRTVYGLDAARTGISRAGCVVVTEGYMDCLMCHQFGIDWAVATLGTALTEDHCRLLGRYAKSVILVFDADNAGQKAAVRSLEIVVRAGCEVKVAVVESGKDPCDSLLAEGAEKFQVLLDRARGAVAFRLDLARRSGEWEGVEGRAAVVGELLRLVKAAADPVRTELYLQEISAETGIPVEALRRQAGGRGGGTSRKSGLRPAVRRKAPVAQEQAERFLLALLIQRLESRSLIFSRLELSDFQTSWSQVARELFSRLQKEPDREVGPGQIAAWFQEPETARQVSQLFDDELGGDLDRLREDCLAYVERSRTREELDRIRFELEDASASGTGPSVDERLRRLQELARLRTGGRAGDKKTENPEATRTPDAR